MMNHLKPMPSSRMSERKTQVVGHRGASGLAPENTLAAFQIALDLGVDGVEFDVQMTRDGHLVVAHDEELDRTTSGSGLLRELSIAELQVLDAGGWFAEDFKGERIPSLPELFDFMRGNDLLLFLELKDPAQYPGMEQAVADLIRKYDFVERVQVRSFDHSALHVFHRIAPEMSISELWYERIPSPEETHFPTIDVLYQLYTLENLAEIHARGQKATAWTVNDMEAARQLIDWGIDSITTDYPDQVLKLL
jgi:glycerophosphoryl diester phosphodiesterase